VSCSVLQCEQFHSEVYGWRGIEYVDLARMMLQCVVVCCSVLQCVAMCCNVLQCELWRCYTWEITVGVGSNEKIR